MATAPVVEESPSTHSGSIESWHALFKRYAAAKRKAQDYEATDYDPMRRAFMAQFPKWPSDLVSAAAEKWSREHGFDVVATRHDELVNGYAELGDELIKRPAPDEKAALWKFDFLFADFDENGFHTSNWSHEYCSQALVDIRRFLSAV